MLRNKEEKIDMHLIYINVLTMVITVQWKYIFYFAIFAHPYFLVLNKVYE